MPLRVTIEPDNYGYDDLILPIGRADFPAGEVDLSVNFVGLQLQHRFMSAAMLFSEAETVTALDKTGGLGVIHRAFKKVGDILRQIEKAKQMGCVNLGVSIGPYWALHAKSMEDAGASVLVYGVANCCNTYDRKAAEDIKAAVNIPLIGGNVIDAETAEWYDPIFDAFLVGYGPGKTCRSRLVTGAGRGQMSAIMDVYSFARTRIREKLIISDGGFRETGDGIKAFAAGASIIMAGGTFAGCNESPEPVVKCKGADGRIIDAKRHIGMGSLEVMAMTSGSDRYMARVSHGEATYVPCSGPLAEIVDKLNRGLREGLFTQGARRPEDLHSFYQGDAETGAPPTRRMHFVHSGGHFESRPNSQLTLVCE